MSNPTPCFVGIDVSKATLDIAIRPSGEQFQIPNDDKEFPALVKRLKALSVERIVLEATGGLEMLVLTHLAAAALPVVEALPPPAPSPTNVLYTVPLPAGSPPCPPSA